MRDLMGDLCIAAIFAVFLGVVLGFAKKVMGVW